MRAIIAPSVLACDLSRLGEAVREVEDAGADWHHVDVMDGHFVPNLTFGPDIVRAIRRASRLPVDVHLMVTNPETHVEPFVRAGAEIVSFHIEAAKDPVGLIRRIHDLGARAGVVVRPPTPVSSVFPYIGQVEMVLVMTVEPGFTGQQFMPDCVPKIRELRRHAGPALDIQVDGGVNEETVAPAAAAGANVVVAGAAIYRADDPRKALQRIRAALLRHYNESP